MLAGFYSWITWIDLSMNYCEIAFMCICQNKLIKSVGLPSLVCHLDNIRPITSRTRTRPANQRRPVNLHVISAPARLARYLQRVLFVCLRGNKRTESWTRTLKGVYFLLMRTPVTAEDSRSRTQREHRGGCWMRVWLGVFYPVTERPTRRRIPPFSRSPPGHGPGDSAAVSHPQCSRLLQQQRGGGEWRRGQLHF